MHIYVVLTVVALGLSILLAMLFRVVVSTNDVHIVQSAKRTVSYGKDQAAGNTYYIWPSWVPIIGVRRIILPVSVFNVDLKSYAAYDKGRVPFVIDIMAFFRIDDSNMAAQRVHSFTEMTEQLKGILQGAIRSILASSEIEDILEGRSRFGELFTTAVDAQLKEWGVRNVKNIELMDIRDTEDSSVIVNIMAKKKSLIEKESRVAVAENLRVAKEAEITAKQSVDIRAQEAEQLVGQRTAQKNREIGVANQQAEQHVKEAAKLTATKTMAILEVEKTRAAEIEQSVQIIQAEQQKQTAVIKAEGEKQQTIILSEGDLGQAKLVAEGVRINGLAKGEADQAVLMAPINTQITLAKEIGGNDGYQKYLLGVKEIEKNQVVGVAQADALKAAEIKVIANSGDVVGGVDGVMNLLTTKGGTQMGAMVEAFAQTATGKALVERFVK